MPIFEIIKDQIRPTMETKFSMAGVRERSDLTGAVGLSKIIQGVQFS